MSKLLDKQQEFTIKIADLIQYGVNHGILFTFGEAFVDPAESNRDPRSTHHFRLGIDLNIFVDGEYITDGNHEAFVTLHDYWDLLEGAERIESDMNHFSMGWKGYR